MWCHVACAGSEAAATPKRINKSNDKFAVALFLIIILSELIGCREAAYPQDYLSKMSLCVAEKVGCVREPVVSREK